MKKILVFGMTDIPGGMESVIMNYYRFIDKEKIQFDFLCNTEKVAYEEEINKLGGKIFRIPARSKGYFKYKNALKNFYKEHSKDYSCIWINVCSLANIDYLKMAKKYGIKTRIIHCHNSQNMDSKLRGLLHKFNRLFISNYATDFWTCSDFASPWFYSQNIIKSKTYKVINNAIDLNKFGFSEDIRDLYRKELGFDDNTLVIGNVGRFHFQKNHPFIINIFEKIVDKKPNSVLLLIGAGEDEEKIRNLVNEKNLKQKVIFLGKREDVNNILQAMDVFLFPSVFEGFGLALVEAQAASLKIFASSDCIPEIVKLDKKNFNSISLNENSDVWAQKIIDSCKNSSKRISNSEIIKSAGYDIEKESKDMQEFFELH